MTPNPNNDAEKQIDHDLSRALEAIEALRASAAAKRDALVRFVLDTLAKDVAAAKEQAALALSHFRWIDEDLRQARDQNEALLKRYDELDKRYQGVCLKYIPADELTATEQVLARANNKIGAIKEVRLRTGLGLKEAKDLVEAWQTKNGCSPAPIPF